MKKLFFLSLAIISLMADTGSGIVHNNNSNIATLSPIQTIKVYDQSTNIDTNKYNIIWTSKDINISKLSINGKTKILDLFPNVVYK